MLRADKALAQHLRLRRSGLHRPAGVLAEPQDGAAGGAGAVHLLHRPAQGVQLYAAAQQEPRTQPLPLAQDAQQQVLRAHAAVPQLPGG